MAKTDVAHFCIGTKSKTSAKVGFPLFSGIIFSYYNKPNVFNGLDFNRISQTMLQHWQW